MSMMGDPRLQRSVTVGVADAGRQALMKYKVNPAKSLTVAAASAVSQYAIAAPLNAALGGLWKTSDAPYVLDLLSEILGIGIALSVFEMLGVASKENTESEGKSKGGKFGKALMLAGVDVIAAELILSLLGNNLPLAGDPAANTSSGYAAPATTTTAVKSTTYVK